MSQRDRSGGLRQQRGRRKRYCQGNEVCARCGAAIGQECRSYKGRRKVTCQVYVDSIPDPAIGAVRITDEVRAEMDRIAAVYPNQPWLFNDMPPPWLFYVRPLHHSDP